MRQFFVHFYAMAEYLFLFLTKKEKKCLPSHRRTTRKEENNIAEFLQLSELIYGFQEDGKKQGEYQTIFFSFPHLETSFSVSSAASANNLIWDECDDELIYEEFRRWSDMCFF